ncbi:MAG: hypothetical protein B7Z66_08665 [Chromatiales bacterium 21-64-14]|nr:MAG: hypothetical protein B7Z66_08665 [Chromatiales bacterium 21-64-14]
MAQARDRIRPYTPGRPGKSPDGGDTSVPTLDRPLSVRQLEWEHLQRVLMRNDNNLSATAHVLGMHRRTLQRKLQKRP